MNQEEEACGEFLSRARLISDHALIKNLGNEPHMQQMYKALKDGCYQQHVANKKQEKMTHDWNNKYLETASFDDAIKN